MVTDNGTHFTLEDLQTWQRRIGCNTLFTAPRHPQSNGQTENFVRSLKTAIRTSSPSSLEDLQTCVDNFLLQYRNAAHSTTRKSPALLFKGRNLRSSMSLDTTEVTFFRGNNARPSEGLVLKRLGDRMFSITDRGDGTVHRRHRDQVTLSMPRQLDEASSIQPTKPIVPQLPDQPSQSPTLLQTPPELTNLETPEESEDRHGQPPPGQLTPNTDPSVASASGSVPSPRRSQRARAPIRFRDFELTGRSCNRNS